MFGIFSWFGWCSCISVIIWARLQCVTSFDTVWRVCVISFSCLRRCKVLDLRAYLESLLTWLTVSKRPMTCCHSQSSSDHGKKAAICTNLSKVWFCMSCSTLSMREHHFSYEWCWCNKVRFYISQYWFVPSSTAYCSRNWTAAVLFWRCMISCSMWTAPVNQCVYLQRHRTVLDNTMRHHLEPSGAMHCVNASSISNPATLNDHARAADVLGHLQANRPSIGSASSYQHVFFKLDVPKAQNVAVVVGGEWTQLGQKEPGSWHGEVVSHFTPIDYFLLVTWTCCNCI